MLHRLIWPVLLLIQICFGPVLNFLDMDQNFLIQYILESHSWSKIQNHFDPRLKLFGHGPKKLWLWSKTVLDLYDDRTSDYCHVLLKVKKNSENLKTVFRPSPNWKLILDQSKIFRSCSQVIRISSLNSGLQRKFSLISQFNQPAAADSKILQDSPDSLRICWKLQLIPNQQLRQLPSR